MDGKYGSVEIDGVLYENPAQAAELLGLGRNTIYKLLKSRPKMSFRDAILYYLSVLDENAETQELESGREVYYNGVKYKSTQDACKKLGLNQASIYYRMRTHKIDFETAVNYDKTQNSRIEQLKDDNTSPLTLNLLQYCNKHDLDYARMYRNINVLGMTVEEAEKKVRERQKTRVSVEYKGVQYGSLAKACKQLNLPYNDIYNAMRRKNVSFEEAIELIYERL